MRVGRLTRVRVVGRPRASGERGNNFQLCGKTFGYDGCFYVLYILTILILTMMIVCFYFRHFFFLHKNFPFLNHFIIFFYYKSIVRYKLSILDPNHNA